MMFYGGQSYLILLNMSTRPRFRLSVYKGFPYSQNGIAGSLTDNSLPFKSSHHIFRESKAFVTPISPKGKEISVLPEGVERYAVTELNRRPMVRFVVTDLTSLPALRRRLQVREAF